MMRFGAKTRKALRHTCGLPDGANPERLSFDAEPIPHDWIEGKWQKAEKFFQTREDECSKCGCTRQMIRHYISAGNYEISVSTYERSRQVFGEDHEPECWGNKNPPKK